MDSPQIKFFEVESMGKLRTLEEWRNVIEVESVFVDVRPYSHNIISLALNAIVEKWGQKEANKAIAEFGLKKLGWNEV